MKYEFEITKYVATHYISVRCKPSSRLFTNMLHVNIIFSEPLKSTCPV